MLSKLLGKIIGKKNTKKLKKTVKKTVQKVEKTAKNIFSGGSSNNSKVTPIKRTTTNNVAKPKASDLVTRKKVDSGRSTTNSTPLYSPKKDYTSNVKKPNYSPKEEILKNIQNKSKNKDKIVPVKKSKNNFNVKNYLIDIAESMPGYGTAISVAKRGIEKAKTGEKLTPSDVLLSGNILSQTNDRIRKSNEKKLNNVKDNNITTKLKQQKQDLNNQLLIARQKNSKDYTKILKKYNKISDELQTEQAKLLKNSKGLGGALEKGANALSSGFDSSVRGFDSTIDRLVGVKSNKRKGASQILGEKAYQDTNSKIGRTALEVTESVGAMIPTIIAGIASGGTATAVSFGTYGGSAYNKAKQDGYTDKQATAYGVVNGGLEAMLNKVLPSFKVGGKNIYGKVATQKISSNIMKKVASNSVLRGVITDGMGEFTEEYLQEFLDPIVREAILEEDNSVGIKNKKDLAEISKNIAKYTAHNFFSKENLHAGLLGFLTSGLMGTPNTISAVRNQGNFKRYANTKQTIEENNKQIEEKKTQATLLNNNLKNKTNTTQNVAETQAQIDTLVNEIQQLKTTNAQINQEIQNNPQFRQLEALNLTMPEIQQLASGNLDINEKLQQVKEMQPYTAENPAITIPKQKGTRNYKIQETLYQIEQNMTPELLSQKLNIEEIENTSYDPLDRLANLYISAKQNLNNSVDTNGIVTMLAKIAEDKGYNIIFNSNLATNENGRIVPKNGVKTIELNPNSVRSTEFILMHELTHAVGTKEIWQDIIDYAKADSKVAKMLNDKIKAYQEQTNYTDEEIQEEVMCDIMGELLGSQEYINHLSQEKPTLFEKILKWLNDFLGRTDKNSYEHEYISKIKADFEEAYRTNENVGDELKNSIKNSNVIEKNDNMEYNKGSIERKFNTIDEAIENDPRKETYKKYNTSIDFFNLEYEEMSKAIALGSKYALEAQRLGFNSYSFNDNKYIYDFDVLNKENNAFGITNVEIIKNISEEVYNERSFREDSRLSEEQHRLQKERNNYDNKSIRNRGTSKTTSELDEKSRTNELVSNEKASIKYSKELDNSSFSYDRIQGLNKTKSEVEDAVYDKFEQMMDEYGFDVDDIQGIYLHGSRLRGTAKANSDLDAVVFYIGNENEDYIFNTINDEKNQLIIDGVKVDINPVSVDSLSEIDDYIRKSEAYDKDALSKQETVKYSKEIDNQGRKLSKQQQEYFKDSKVRDEKGNLITVYHTMTSSGTQFNEFNPVGTDYYKFGDQVVNYYTDSKEMSGSYANQKYTMADTSKFNNINEVKEWLSQQNKYIHNHLMEEYGIKPTLKEGAYFLTINGDPKILFETEEKLLKNVKKKFYEYNKQFGSDKGYGKYQYEGYANITNPYVVDAEERNWNQVIQQSNDFIDELEERIPQDVKDNLTRLYQESANKSAEARENYEIVEQVIRQGIDGYQSAVDEEIQKANQVVKKVGFNEIEQILNDTQNIGVNPWYNIAEALQDEGVIGSATKTFIIDEFKLPKQVKEWLQENYNKGIPLHQISTNNPLKLMEQLDRNATPSLKDIYNKNAQNYEEFDKYRMPNSYFMEQISSEGNDYLGNELNDIFETRAEIYSPEQVGEEIAQASSVAFSKPEMIRLWGTSKTTNDVVKEIIASNKDGKTNYDGVIIKNVYDYGGHSATGTQANDLYITFNSNQFKAVDNTEPTKDADIRYSIEPTMNDATTMDNKSLKALTKNMKQQLGLNRVQVNELEQIIQKHSKSGELNKDSIYKDIKDRFSKQSIESDIQEVKDVQKLIRDTKIDVSQNIKNDIADYNKLKQRNFGKIKFSNDGQPVDVVYQELNNEYPNYFPENIYNETEQFQKIVEVANYDNKVLEEYDIDDNYIRETSDYIYDSIRDYHLDQRKKLANEELDFITDQYSTKRKKKMTRKAVREQLLKEMNISAYELQKGKDISSPNYQLTDPIRVNEKVFGRELGKKINEATIERTKHNTAEKTRWLNKERKEIKALGIKPRSKESSAVQKYGEKQYINEKGELVHYGDRELMNEFPDIKTQEKIKKASEILRGKYDLYIDQINKTLEELGYDPIPKRKDYMRHFAELGDVFSQTGVPFNLNDMKAEELPTDINGLTEFNKPGKNWFASSQKRYGNKTNYDAITGIDGYLEGAGNLIFHTEDIQRYRALSTMIRDTFGQTKGFENLEGLSDKELNQRISDIQSNKLSKYVAWLDEQANSLAGKKGAIDRGVERALGRKGYTALSTIKKQVGSNMTGFNVRSALTNFISTTIASAKTNKIAMAKGTVATIRNMFKNDGFINKSDFLTSRFGSDMLSNKLWQRASNAGQIFMTGSDYLTANIITRSKYYEGLHKGMSEEQAIKYADDFASRVMGDRSQGSTAEVFNSKTLGLLTQFQLEVNNQWQYMIHDSKMDYQKIKAKSNGINAGATIVFQMGQLAGFSYFFNELFESLTGSRSAFDPIEIFKKLFGLDDDDKDKTQTQRIEEAVSELLDNIPFGNLLTGGGRIPIAEALPIKELINGKDKNGYDKSRLKTLKETAPYYLLPTGYSQLKKTKQGLSMFSKDKKIKGSYTDSGKLRFAVEDTTKNKVKAGLFGQWSSKEAQEYIDKGYMPLNENQIDTVEELSKYGLSVDDYRKYKQKVSSIAKENEDYVESKKQIIQEIKNMDISDEAKYALYDSSYNKTKKINVAKEVGISADAYLDYASQNFVSDKTKSGKIIFNSKKKKVFKYIDNMDISTTQKAILKKQKYNSYTEKDNQILKYIDGKNIGAKKKKDLLESLGFKVNGNSVSSKSSSKITPYKRSKRTSSSRTRKRTSGSKKSTKKSTKTVSVARKKVTPIKISTSSKSSNTIKAGTTKNNNKKVYQNALKLLLKK